MPQPLRIGLCPELTVHVDGRRLSGTDLGSRKARTLMALLATHRGQLLPLDRIADVLWPADVPADPGANVSTLVSRMRRLLGEELVLARGRTYGFAAEACTTDLDEARVLAGEARDRLRTGETALAAAAARRSLEVLGPGPALVGEPDADWVLDVRHRADDLRRTARHVLAQALTAVEPSEAGHVAAEALTADPYDERAVRDLMRALVADGRPTAALAAYDDLARRLREELGTDPDAGTTELHLAILREQPPAEEQDAAPPGRTNSRLVGREDEMGRLDACWAEAGAGHGRLVVLDGESGIGKTRLLEALAEVVRVERRAGAPRPVPPGRAVAVPAALRRRAASAAAEAGGRGPR